MSFHTVLESVQTADNLAFLASVDAGRVERALSASRKTNEDFLALLSPAADAFLEPMARLAASQTRRQFGNSIVLFTPLYISNICENRCAYCSFASHNRITRKHLEADEIRTECEHIASTGMRHILVLTGESRTAASPAYLASSVSIVREYFSSVGMEVYPLTEAEYRLVIEAGVDSLTLFQETYHEPTYAQMHAGGPKSDYRYRLDAPERACAAGMHAVNLGSLLGLYDFRIEALHTAMHIRYLQSRYPGVELALSLPRLRPLAADFTVPAPVSDRQFVQLLTAYRLMFPTLGITVSTREPADLRDNLVPLGVTRMSAGVSTSVGSSTSTPSTSQFEISDERSVEEMKADLLRLGFQPVMHDWNHRLLL